jgi:glycosyltransferase involved in cell wall biosynthesis
MNVDIFLELSQSDVDQIPALLNQVYAWDGLGLLKPAVTCILPDSAAVPSCSRELQVARPDGAVRAAGLAAQAAGATGHSLLFLFGPFFPSSEAVGGLAEVLERDPLFGFAVPRIATEDGAAIECYSVNRGETESSVLPRRAICELPDFYLVPEMVSCCTLVRNSLLANWSLRTAGFRTVSGALLYFLAKVRRTGFRGVVANRVLVPGCSEASRTDTPAPPDVWELLRLIPDSSRAHLERGRLPFSVREKFLARAHSTRMDTRRSLLLDATAMRARFNGTSECFLGLAGGLQAVRHDWTVTVAAQPEAAEFHQLRRRLPHWEITDGTSAHRYTVGLQLSQPWAFRTMLRLHQQALLNYYLVLDTIAWDVLYNAPEHLDEIWRFLSQYADGLLYISDFTCQRFRTRFPLGLDVKDETLHLSFHSRDYVRPDARRKERTSSPPYLLVVGNSYDHKDLAIAVDTLAACFPFQCIRALGLVKPAHPNVEAVPSGSVSEIEMERLYANAQAVVFPSLYEGFGFPIIRGLSYGRPVVARRSALLDELAAHYQGEGRLLAYSTYLEMAELMSALLRGEPVGGLQFGSAVAPGSAPLDWTAIAANMLDIFERRLVEPGHGLWASRDNVFRLMTAFRT